MEGLSPIADVDGETESSQNSQFGGFPDLDVSYGSTGGTPRVMGAGGQAGNQVSPTTECEPLAYLRYIHNYIHHTSIVVWRSYCMYVCVCVCVCVL